MSALFSPIKLRGLALANRIMVAPMCQYSADDGTANDWHLMHIGNFAMGGFRPGDARRCYQCEMVGRITHKCADNLHLENEAGAQARRRFRLRSTGTSSSWPAGRPCRAQGFDRPTPAAGRQAAKEHFESLTLETLAPSAIPPYGPDWHVPRAIDQDANEVNAQRLH